MKTIICFLQKHFFGQKQVPIIALSAQSREESEGLPKDLFDDWLSKPLRREELRKKFKNQH